MSKVKKSQVHIYIEEDFKDKFNKFCESRQRSASFILRDFIIRCIQSEMKK